MRAADLFVACLEAEGVKYIFGVPGEETLDFTDALSNSKKIAFIPTRHEQGAAFIADVYGRLTGRAGVCLATLGPGATNLITGLADAYLDLAPVVAITGQAGLDRRHKESHQYINVVNMLQPTTKWNTVVTSASIIPEVVRKAFKVAEQERPGATHIELPEDMAEAEVKGAPLKSGPPQHTHPGPERVKEAFSILSRAKQPVLLVGNGAVRAGATDSLLAFLEQNPIPTANTFMSKGILSAEHDLSLGTIGLQMNDYVLCGFSAADVVVTVGYDLVEYAPNLWNPDKDKKLIHIGAQPAEVDEYYVPDVEVIGNVRESLIEMAKKKVIHGPHEYSMRLKEHIRNELFKHVGKTDFPLKPQKLIYDLRAAMAPKDLLICDVGAHKLWVARMFRAQEPNTVIISNGFASMGIALPGAIGAKLARPACNVVAVTGDGGFMMNVQELETAVRLSLDFTVVIFNDSKYGVIEWHQKKKFNRSFGVDFTNPDFVKLAEAFGCNGHRVEKAQDLLPTLKKAIAEKGVSIVDVPVDYSENMRLTKQLGQNICPI